MFEFLATTSPRRKRKISASASFEYCPLEPKRLLAADGIVVANYRQDFSDADTGWTYGFNSTEQLHGAESQFESLLSDDGVLLPRTPTVESGLLKLTATGGHAAQDGDRFVIASWTAAESGVYSISDSFASVDVTGFSRADGIEFRVFVNSDSPLKQENVNVSKTEYFDMTIGHLNAGDSINVAFGSRSNHAFDRFKTDFSIRMHPQRLDAIANLRQTVNQNLTTDARDRIQNDQWQTLWNAPVGWDADGTTGDQSTGSIDDVDSYRSLQRADASTLTASGIRNARLAPQYFLQFNQDGGHTGIGFDATSRFEDRFVIAATTIDRSGPYSLTDTFLNVSNRSADGIELRVFVNDPRSPVLQTVVAGGAETTFDQSLGNLNKGDTVYVAFGANDNHNGDRFETDFSLVRELPREKPLREITTENVIHVRDFGAFPDDRAGDVAGISAAIEAARRSDVPTTIQFDPGVYNIYSTPVSETGNPRYFFSLFQQQDLEIDGQGAQLLVENNDRGLFRVSKSQNVILRDLTIDYVDLYQAGSDPSEDLYRVNTFSQGLISEIDPAQRSFVLTVDPRVTVDPDASFISGNTPQVQAWGFLLDGEEGSRLKYNSRWHYQTRNVEPLGNRQFRITVDSLINFADGDRYVLQRRTNVGAIGVFADSTQISIIDVTIHASPSAFLTAKEATSVNVIRSSAEVLADAGRWRSINADAVHGQALRTGFWVEDSSFDAVGDDVMNFYSVPSAAIDQPSSNQLTVATVTVSSLVGASDSKWKIGDVAAFVEPANARILQEARVTAVESIVVEHPEVGRLVTQTLTFDQNVANIRFASNENGTDPLGYVNDTTIYNQSVSRGFLVQGTTLANARRYGQFVMANDVQLVDNSYVGLSDSAIAGHNESNWPIGLYAENVLVQSNRFLRNGFSQRYFQERYFAGVVAFHADQLGHRLVDRADYLYSRITISDNIFRGWGKTAIAVRNAYGVTISDNQIYSPLAFPINNRPWFAVDLQFNRDVDVNDNELFSNVQFLTSQGNQTVEIDGVEIVSNWLSMEQR